MYIWLQVFTATRRLCGCGMWGPFYELWHVGSFGFPGGSVIKSPPAFQETQVFDPWVGEIPWRRKYSSILAWEVPRTEEPGGLQSLG